MSVEVTLMFDVDRIDPPDDQTTVKFETDDNCALIVLCENANAIWVVRAYAPGTWKFASKVP